MSLEYAPRGLIGVLTPQANTTVEPEFNLLLPLGVAMITARLTSSKTSLTERLADYFASYGDTLRQFANAPIKAFAAACTGASYLAGRDREAMLVKEISARSGVPFITAALAVVDALKLLRARSVGLVSPYPADLARASIGYWESHGFEIAKVVEVSASVQGFHPIYEISGVATAQALQSLHDSPLDAIVMLGTGTPTLLSITEAIEWNRAPVLSCNLALAWRAVEALDGQSPRSTTLEMWLRGDHWLQQFRVRQQR